MVTRGIAVRALASLVVFLAPFLTSLRVFRSSRVRSLMADVPAISASCTLAAATMTIVRTVPNGREMAAKIVGVAYLSVGDPSRYDCCGGDRIRIRVAIATSSGSAKAIALSANTSASGHGSCGVSAPTIQVISVKLIPYRAHFRFHKKGLCFIVNFVVFGCVTDTRCYGVELDFWAIYFLYAYYLGGI